MLIKINRRKNIVLSTKKLTPFVNSVFSGDAIREMIPWCFAYDKLNYARYLPAYYAQMTNLPEEHPEVYQEFRNGKFAVQLSEENPFGRIPVDQATEVTVNKDTQTVGGTTKVQLETRCSEQILPGRVQEWILGETEGHGQLKQKRIQSSRPPEVENQGG